MKPTYQTRTTSVALRIASGSICALFLAPLAVTLAGSSCTQRGTHDGSPRAVQEPIEGGPYPALLLSQAWFWKDEQGKSRPGPARLTIWRQTPNGWRASRLEDGDSNVFHKTLIQDGSILTIGAEKAILKRWRFSAGHWTSDSLWQKAWGGQFNRLRDIEIGDVDGDGKDEYVIATHDMGVVAVYDPSDGMGPSKVIELDPKPDTFVHEIEIGDIDGDGRKEFFATPTERNLGNASQPGQVVMYRWNGSEYERTVVDTMNHTHAKELLTTDIDGDGRDELYAAVEGEVAGGRLVRGVEIRQYVYQKSGGFRARRIATIDDRQTRFLVAADYDGDGRKELVAAAMKTGLYLISPSMARKKSGQANWSVRPFERVSSSFEHAIVAADLDRDGLPELYVAADDQGELNRYVWDRTAGGFRKTRVGSIDTGSYTWNIAAGWF
jgi:hypothetical protein